MLCVSCRYRASSGHRTRRRSVRRKRQRRGIVPGGRSSDQTPARLAMAPQVSACPWSEARMRRATSRPAHQPEARPRGGGPRRSVDTPVAISNAITELASRRESSSPPCNPAIERNLSRRQREVVVAVTLNDVPSTSSLSASAPPAGRPAKCEQTSTSSTATSSWSSPTPTPIGWSALWTHIKKAARPATKTTRACSASSPMNAVRQLITRSRRVGGLQVSAHASAPPPIGDAATAAGACTHEPMDTASWTAHHLGRCLCLPTSCSVSTQTPASEVSCALYSTN
jgi:hypothetical protein